MAGARLVYAGQLWLMTASEGELHGPSAAVTSPKGGRSRPKRAWSIATLSSSNLPPCAASTTK